MVGVKQFDEDAVLDRLIGAFWAGGYEGTSIDDLTAATGLKRGSLYNAFGDKAAMFARAIDRYSEIVSVKLRAALRDDDPVRGLTRYVNAHVEGMADASLPAGCMMVGACTELGGRSCALGRKVADDLNQSEIELCDALTRWQADGRMRGDRDVRDLARFLGSLLRGMAVVHKATGNLDQVRDAGRVGLEVISQWVATEGKKA